MSFIKTNIKLIIGIIIGILLATGSVFAYSYFASDISYNKKTGTDTTISVETALNDLYSKLPTGTIPITTKGSQIDVSNYKYADTTGLYTSEEYQNYGTTQYNNGKNESVKVIKNHTLKYNNGNWTAVELGFRPQMIVFIDSVSVTWARNGDSSMHFFFDDGSSSSSSYGSFETTSTGFKYKLGNINDNNWLVDIYAIK